MKKQIILKSLLLTLTIGLLLFACSKKDNSYSNNNNNNTTGNGGNKVNITNFSFVSASLKVTKGTTVIWTNSDATTHTVTADDNSFTSGSLSKGDTYSHQFNNAGTYKYHCKFHSMMTASVVVN